MVLIRAAVLRAAPSTSVAWSSTTRVLARTTSQPCLRLGQYISRRGYASPIEAVKKTSDLPWIAAAVFGTTVGTYIALSPSDPHGDHGHDEHHEEKHEDGGDEEDSSEEKETPEEHKTADQRSEELTKGKPGSDGTDNAKKTKIQQTQEEGSHEPKKVGVEEEKGGVSKSLPLEEKKDNQDEEGEKKDDSKKDDEKKDEAKKDEDGKKEDDKKEDEKKEDGAEKKEEKKD